MSLRLRSGSSSTVTFELPPSPPKVAAQQSLATISAGASVAAGLEQTNISRREEILNYKLALLEANNPQLAIERERREVELARAALEEKKKARAAIAAAKRHAALNQQS